MKPKKLEVSLIRGVVKSYSAEKGFGFVDGADGISYFLHKKQLKDQAQASRLIIGANVEFDPMPTPKGMQANKVSVLETCIGRFMPDFELSRKGELRGAEVAWEHQVVWPSTFTDFNQAELDMIAFAKRNGANAILNFRIEKETSSSGNYQFTVGRPKFSLAIVTKNIHVGSQSEVDKLNMILNLAIDCASRADDELTPMTRKVEAPKSSLQRILAVLIALATVVYLLGKS